MMNYLIGVEIILHWEPHFLALFSKHIFYRLLHQGE